MSADKTYDVTALGELLIDFTENGVSAQGNPVFEANPGGAPCNVLAMLAKLGYRTAFISELCKFVTLKLAKLHTHWIFYDLLVEPRLH